MDDGTEQFLRLTVSPDEFEKEPTESSYAVGIDFLHRAVERGELSHVVAARFEHAVSCDDEWGGRKIEKRLGRPLHFSPEWRKQKRKERNERINQLHRQYFLGRGKPFFNKNADAIYELLVRHNLSVSTKKLARMDALIREIRRLCRWTGGIPTPVTLRKEILG